MHQQTGESVHTAVVRDNPSEQPLEDWQATLSSMLQTSIGQSIQFIPWSPLGVDLSLNTPPNPAQSRIPFVFHSYLVDNYPFMKQDTGIQLFADQPLSLFQDTFYYQSEEDYISQQPGFVRTVVKQEDGTSFEKKQREKLRIPGIAVVFDGAGFTPS
ncbi:hypothetical protein BLNAU_2755 [Blattamonas nauphoetae]|uniref:Uncharacterized protein n=1 Tax=Blattamonas nauphoetae TaxID=2049346 RepID=A0ABQ9YE94_9EUKA|nr:hypothetical protein BLNAU_2755 [Blattamonas nauphoetae]